jgi:DNA polymerase III subunit epsilon
MYIILDCENSGLFDFSKPADAEGQPRLAELAMIYANENLEFERDYTGYVKPDGWEMSAETTAINGITNEHLAEHGLPIVEVLNVYHSAIKEGRIVIAYNAQFDLKQLRGESRRAGLDDLFETTPNVCAMRASTDVCRIPYKNGRAGFKFPKLSEACEFFKIEQSGQHTAMGDAIACWKISQKLKEIGKLPDAAVHYAKNHPNNEAVK